MTDSFYLPIHAPECVLLQASQFLTVLSNVNLGVMIKIVEGIVKR
mgnify:CR=1 FL=1